MPIRARCAFDFFVEITRSSERWAPPLSRESVQADLADLVDDTFVSAVLADELPAEVDDLEIVVSPVWDQPPVAEGIQVSITGRGGATTVHRSFRSGRWSRRAQSRAWAWVDDGVLGDGETIFVRLHAEERGRDHTLFLPSLHPPPISSEPLAALNVARLGDELLCADRPVLVNARMVEQILDDTEVAGATEIGGSVLGTIVRLAEPLPGTTTRFVTVLTAALPDPRHAGELGRVTFDPGALAHAAGVAESRGMGERVMTVFHSHGWGSRCGRCNHNADCAIPSAGYVSPDDYQVLESLLPDKSTVMPIAGRKLGAGGNRPVLVIHAWRDGRMEPIPWRTYHD